MTNTAVKIKNLTKKYDDFTLSNISLEIPSGSIVGLIGENGAGKSTFISSLLGITRATYDELNVLGKNFKENEKTIKNDIAVIFEDTHFNQEFSPKLIGTILSKIYQNWDMNAYRHHLEQFSIPFTKKIKKFSRGMKMKMEFAIAFSHDAKLIILDEATSGLDPIVRDEILSLLRKFTEDEDHTVLMSSHITSDLDKISDYIAYIHKGKLLFMRPYEELHEDYGILSAKKELLEALNEEDIVSVIKELYHYCVLIKNRYAVQKTFRDLEIKRPTIEEIMLFYAKGAN